MQRRSDDLYRYVTADNAEEYIAIMSLFSSTLLADLSAGEAQGGRLSAPVPRSVSTTLKSAVASWSSGGATLCGRFASHVLPRWPNGSAPAPGIRYPSSADG